MEYKNTIITPKTGFPMKAGLPAREPGMLKNWEEQNLYQALLEKNKDLPPFVLHDGPPFSNGTLAMRHPSTPPDSSVNSASKSIPSASAQTASRS